LVKEIQSLGMDVEVGYANGEQQPSLPPTTPPSPLTALG